MKIFVVTSILGQDAIKSAALLGRACSALAQAGHNPTHNLSEIQFLQENQIGEAETLRKAYLGIDQSDAVLLIIQPNIQNDDAIAAFGYGWAKGKKLFVAYPLNQPSPLLKLASIAIQYSDLADLGLKLTALHH